MARGKGGDYGGVAAASRRRRALDDFDDAEFTMRGAGANRAERISKGAADDYQAMSSASKRQDRALLNDIQSRLYKIDFDTVKPSQEVAFKTGFRRHIYSKKVPLEDEYKEVRRREELRNPRDHTRESLFRPRRKQKPQEGEEETEPKELRRFPKYEDYDPIGHDKRHARRERERIRREREEELDSLIKKIPLRKTKEKEEEELKKAAENLSTTHNSKALLAKLRAKSYMMKQKEQGQVLDNLLDMDNKPMRFAHEHYRPSENISPSNYEYYDPTIHEGTEGGLDPITRRKINESRFEMEQYEAFLNNMYKPQYPTNMLLSKLQSHVIAEEDKKRKQAAPPPPPPTSEVEPRKQKPAPKVVPLDLDLDE